MALLLGAWPVSANALLHHRTPVAARGRLFAATGFLGNIGVLLGFGAAWLFADEMPAAVLLMWVGGLLATAALILVIAFRVQCAAWLLTLPIRLRWPTRITGLEHIPPQGGCLLVCNHLSYADALIIGAVLHRRVRFVADGFYVNMPVIGWIMRLFGTIAIDASGKRGRSVLGALEAATAAAQRGETVCLFPEGHISASGQVNPFRRGMERVARGAGVPVIPMALRGLYGSMLSRAPHRRLRLRRRRVHLHIGSPRPPSTDCSLARADVASLYAEVTASIMKPQHDTTLARAFLARVRRNPRGFAIADPQGELTVLQLAAAAQACRSRLDLPADEERIGILLPPGRAGTIINLALAMDGRVAVNINHTAGEVGLRHIQESAGLRTVITAAAYTKRIGQPDLPVRWVQVEDLLKRIGTWDRIRAAAAVLLLPRRMLCRGKADDVAAILFSSGSTGRPKGAQLTHRQILANVDGAVEHLAIRPGSDRLLSPLPLFHSFGLSTGTWLGLVQGVGVISQPDPRDAAGTGPMAGRHGATFLISTPTFVRAYLRRIDAQQFATLRFAVVGAEKCPPELAERFQETYGAPLLEGYGCTELGPVVSANRLDEKRQGVHETGSKPGSIGRPLPGVEVFAMDPDSQEILPPDHEGLLVVRSPARMLGYLDDPERTDQAFVHGGYNTGDIGRVDAEGFITITGRLARFAKIGGEMVPLDNVERALSDSLKRCRGTPAEEGAESGDESPETD
ncbi:MAG: AMP-binding protein, partial [Planctomycetota bacterium]